MINGNYTIGEDQQLYSMLTNPSNVLKILYIWGTRLSSRGAIYLFTAIKDNNKLKALHIEGNEITDDACDAITAALERNRCLVTLSMYHNPLSSETITNILRSLEHNDALKLLGIPRFSQSIQEYIRSLQELINKKRDSQGCQVKLNIEFNYV